LGRQPFHRESFYVTGTKEAQGKGHWFVFPFLALCPTVELGPAAIVKATEVDRPTFPSTTLYLEVVIGVNCGSQMKIRGV
jgi:hypothetical protein